MFVDMAKRVFSVEKIIKLIFFLNIKIFKVHLQKYHDYTKIFLVEMSN